MIFKNKKNQRGDSLVAIAVSIVALGVTMTGAYVLLRSSFNQGQEAKERAQVRKLVNSQIEILKTHMLHPRSSGDPDLTNSVCDSAHTELSACLDKLDDQANHVLDLFCFNEYDYIIRPRIDPTNIPLFETPPDNANRYSTTATPAFTVRSGDPSAHLLDIDAIVNDLTDVRNPISTTYVGIDDRITTKDQARRYFECAGTSGDIANTNVIVGIIYYYDPDDSNNPANTSPPPRENGDEYLFNVRAYWTARGGQTDNLEASIRLDPLLADPIQSQFN